MTAQIRPACLGDAAHLAILVDMAGEGLPTWVWAQLADEADADVSAFEMGRLRARRDEGGFSWRNAFVADAENTNGETEVAGAVIGYVLDDPYDMPDLETLPEPFRPLVGLEAEAPGSWYLNVLAVYSDFQGRGVGSALLAKAEDLARQAGCREVSLIWAEQNQSAAGLYRRAGYRERARAPIVAYPGARHGGNWVLLVKQLN